MSRDQIRDIDLSPEHVTYRRRAGETEPTPPRNESFWVAQATTADADQLEWEVESGDWTVVLMNVDASRGVDLDATRHQGRLLLPAAIALVVGGLVALGGGTWLIIAGSRGLSRAAEVPAPTAPTPAGWPAPTAPAVAPITAYGEGVSSPPPFRCASPAVSIRS